MCNIVSAVERFSPREGPITAAMEGGGAAALATSYTKTVEDGLCIGGEHIVQFFLDDAAKLVKDATNTSWIKQCDHREPMLDARVLSSEFQDMVENPLSRQWFERPRPVKELLVSIETTPTNYGVAI
jgi:hypothetical protein